MLVRYFFFIVLESLLFKSAASFPFIKIAVHEDEFGHLNVQCTASGHCYSMTLKFLDATNASFTKECVRRAAQWNLRDFGMHGNILQCSNSELDSEIMQLSAFAPQQKNYSPPDPTGTGTSEGPKNATVASPSPDQGIETSEGPKNATGAYPSPDPTGSGSSAESTEKFLIALVVLSTVALCLLMIIVTGLLYYSPICQVRKNTASEFSPIGSKSAIGKEKSIETDDRGFQNVETVPRKERKTEDRLKHDSETRFWRQRYLRGEYVGKRVNEIELHVNLPFRKMSV